ncbi:methyl-accepting chemotaxis protein [Kiloniella sp. b19]|uniref:methyl-accepting chemotaxis protein n=1 Tax=Kiloniella sp. GXU_MW_B19 TaxID=3141326 RepID=UPI0031D1732E
MSNIRAIFTALFAGLMVSAAVLVYSFNAYNAAIKYEGETRDNRYYSYLLADELRQSSDDLTRLARTYVITGDSSYKDQYFDILAIRGGEKERPSDYHRIYWDFVAAGEAKPRPGSGVKAPLLDLMKEAGFTDEEFAKLSEAQANSNGLVNTEVVAMNLVEGKDDQGNPVGTSDFERARTMMHSVQYHEFKANIMRPVDEFFLLLEKRTQSEIDVAEEDVVFYRNMMLGALAFSILMALALCFFVYSRVIVSMGRISQSMERIAGGDVETAVEESHRSDEIGKMAGSVEFFRKSAVEKREQDAQRQSEREAMAREAAQERSSLAESFRQEVFSVFDSLRNSSGNINAVAGQLNSIAAQTQDYSGTMIRECDHTSTSIQSVASATEELEMSVREIDRQLGMASTVVKTADDVAQQTNEEVGSLAEAANKIGEVVNLIQDIAEQTNLLALNATIEAARAGEAGKGFAVVATEVKSLANQTASATEQISNQIGGIQTSTSSAVEAISRITATIEEISQVTGVIASAVEEQGAATNEIAVNIRNSADAANNLTSTMSQLDSTIQETSSTAESSLGASSQMVSATEQLEQAVEQFLRRMEQSSHAA